MPAGAASIPRFAQGWETCTHAAPSQAQQVGAGGGQCLRCFTLSPPYRTACMSSDIVVGSPREGEAGREKASGTGCPPSSTPWSPRPAHPTRGGTARGLGLDSQSCCNKSPKSRWLTTAFCHSSGGKKFKNQGVISVASFWKGASLPCLSRSSWSLLAVLGHH